MRICNRNFLSVALCFFVQVAISQKKHILLIGTAHNFENISKQNFDEIVRKLVAFKPDIICFEAIPSWDTLSQQKVLLESAQRANKIILEMGLNPRTLSDSLDYYKKMIAKKKIPTAAWSKLGLYYFLNRDFAGNSNYNWYRAAKAYDDNKEATDSLVRQYLQSEKKSEFHNIIFPVAANLNLRQLYGVDDRSTSPQDEDAQNETQQELINLPKGKEKIAIYLKSQADYEAAEKKGTAFDLINDSDYQQTISDLITNIYPEVTTSNPAKQMKELWEKRNLSIAKRIINVIKENNHTKKILIFFGAAHIPLLKKYLENLIRGYKIVSFKDL